MLPVVPCEPVVVWSGVAAPLVDPVVLGEVCELGVAVVLLCDAGAVLCWLPVCMVADWSVGAVAVPLPLVLPEVELVPVWASVMPAPSNRVPANIINLRIKIILRAGGSPRKIGACEP